MIGLASGVATFTAVGLRRLAEIFAAAQAALEMAGKKPSSVLLQRAPISYKFPSEKDGIRSIYFPLR